MVTRRGWWLMTTASVVLGAGLLGRLPMLSLVGIAILLWFFWEWILFTTRLAKISKSLSIAREVWDERGPVKALWSGRAFTVRVTLRADGLRLPFFQAYDRLPFGVAWHGGDTILTGEIGDQETSLLEYRILCERPGLARFEGIRLRVADLQGFFHHATFLAAPVELPILPRLVNSEGRPATTKRFNLLPPPGVHRLRQAGTGSELLDLRDYLPGDPPRTIAWKVSARRDRLITKEFESEVPVRCTLFLDTSSSVLVPDAKGKAIHRLVEIAAGVMQAGSVIRDLTGLCLFDERGVSNWLRPGRTGSQVTDMLQVLARAAAGSPLDYRVDPELLLPLAYTFAQEVYPHLLHPTINNMPSLVAWFMPFPRFTRRKPTIGQFLHRRKNLAWFVPFLAPLFWLFAQVVTERGRRLGFWRKQMAALLSIRYGLFPSGLAHLLEDDDAFALMMQRFLADHQVPYSLPLHDGKGRYLFAAPGKVEVLAQSLLRAVNRGRDNELFVLLTDILELDEHLAPLIRAVRVAVSRHHQVLLVCPWPADLPPPSRQDEKPRSGEAAIAEEKGALEDLLRRSLRKHFQMAFQRLRRTFGRLGVQVVCAAADEPAPLILERMERLRMASRRRR